MAEHRASVAVAGRFWWERGEALRAAFVAAAVVLLYVVIAATHGALDASRNDDWVYLRTEFHFAETGEFVADPWSLAIVVGLIVLASPVVAVVGPSIAATHLLVAVMAAVGLWACYLVIRSFLPRGWSAFSVACLALGPVYGTVATSFMTDVPSFCFQMLCLLAGVVALRGDRLSLPWFGTALAAGFVAFSIREYAIAAPAAVTVAATAWTWPRSRRLAGLVVAIGAAWVVAAAALYVWRAGLLDTPGVIFDGKPTDTNVSSTRRAIFTLALMTVPVVPLISIPRLAAALWRRKALVAVTAVLGAIVAIQFGKSHGRLLGNYLTAYGSYAETVAGTPPTVIPAFGWTVLTVVALASLVVAVALGVLGVGTLARSWRRWQAPQSWGAVVAVLFCGAAGGILLAVKLFTSAPLYDRYLLALVPFVVALLARLALDHDLVVTPRRVVAGASLGVFAALGLGLVDTAATLDGAKWRVAQSVSQLGYPADAIDGGYEWYGLYQPVAIKAWGLPPADRNFWIGLFPDRTVCATTQYGDGPAAFAPDSEPVILARSRARSLLGVEYDLVAVAGPQPCQPSIDGHP